MDRNDGDKVILVVIEDLSASAVESHRTPNLELLIKTGAATMKAELTGSLPMSLPLFGILASKRAPTGSAAAIREQEIAEARHSVAALAVAMGRSVAGYHQSARVGRLRQYGIPPCRFSPESEEATGDHMRNLHRTVISAANDIVSFRTDFCLIHLGTEEHIGYPTDPMSPQNLAHLAFSDQALGMLLETLSLFGLFGQYHILVTGDCGSGMMSEGAARVRRTVPWVAFGPRIARGHRITERVSILDTAPTIARIMELPQLPSWDGRVVEEIMLRGKRTPLGKVA